MVTRIHSILAKSVLTRIEAELEAIARKMTPDYLDVLGEALFNADPGCPDYDYAISRRSPLDTWKSCQIKEFYLGMARVAGKELMEAIATTPDAELRAKVDELLSLFSEE